MIPVSLPENNLIASTAFDGNVRNEYNVRWAYRSRQHKGPINYERA